MKNCHFRNGIISAALLFSAQALFAANSSFTCPSADTLKNFDGDYVETMPAALDSNSHQMTVSIMQKKSISETEKLIFVLSGVAIAEGENEDDKARQLVGHLQPETDTSIPFWVSGPKGNHYFTDHYEHICSYTMSGNDQVKAVVFYVKDVEGRAS